MLRILQGYSYEFHLRDVKLGSANSTQLFLAVAVNCFSSRVYGEFEFWFSTVKVITIVFISKPVFYLLPTLLLNIVLPKLSFV